MSDKTVLRRELRERRRALHAAHPLAGEQAAAHWAAAAPGRFGAAALYRATGFELDPEPLGRTLAGEGAELCLPTVTARGQALAFRRWRPGDDLVPDALGLLGPVPGAAAVKPELVVTPLLAFDATGGRLGQGGGFYDRTIEQLRAEGGVFVLGLAFAGQEVEKLPAETHDQPLDGVLTEGGVRLFAKER
jgi:5-formyltetrahydrofolate cyclo-ligase